MPIVVKAETDDPRFPAQVLPISLYKSISERMALALHTPVAGPLRHEGEDVLGVMPLQRPENFADGWRDPSRNATSAFAELHDLACAPIDLRPAQEAFLEPQPGGAGKGKERRKIFAGGGVELVGLIIGYFTHPLGGNRQEMLYPF